MKRRITEKDREDIFVMRNEDNMTLQQIADEYGVTRQRINQILNMDPGVEALRKAVRAEKARRKEERTERMRVLSNEGLKSPVIAERMGVSDSRVRQLLLGYA